MTLTQTNLLIDRHTLEWEAGDNFDRSEQIEDFMLAHGLARDNQNKIYNAEQIYHISFNNINIFELFANREMLKEVFPWLQTDHKRFISHHIMNYGATPNQASNLEELKTEFPKDINGLMGIGEQSISEYVYNEVSWYWLHILYCTDNPHSIDWSENDVLPNVAFSNQLILDLVDTSNQLKGEATENDKLGFFEEYLIRQIRNNKGQIIELAREVAKRNYYIEDTKLSSEEQKQMGNPRYIFKIEKNGHFQYLSLDTENAQFEVCNEKGEHIGVWNFSGRNTQEADTSGEHDLRSLKKN